MSKKILFISLILVLLFLSSVENSFACSCIVLNEPVKKQVKDAYNGAFAVFSGQVVEISPKDQYTVTVKLKVENTWKGKLTDEVTITTASDSAMCGYNFEKGKRYLVYAYGKKDNLTVQNCSRTTAGDGSDDIKILKKLKPKKIKANAFFH